MVSMAALPLQSHGDPDAQATINDFLDYTEFFPSDLHRSLSLIGKLDESYDEYAQQVHNLTRTYGRLPDLTPEARPEPLKLRKDISTALKYGVRARVAAEAEATRLCKTADILYNRLVTIREKLLNLPKPPSRDPSPARQTRSPEQQRKDRAPRITLFTDSNRPRSSGTHNHVPRARRLIVPGEVLPPEELMSPGEDISTDDESEFERQSSVSRYRDKVSRERTPGWSRLPKTLKLDKIRKIPKTPTIRPPGLFGTNVHSQVAGISVSNAMALLERPPENPTPGSVHAPWNDLTEWELNLIRKRMKKNANWMPSDVMKRRELAARGRGLENYEAAKALAESQGIPFLEEVDSQPAGPGGPSSTPHMPTASDMKKYTRDRERAERDRREMDELGRQVADAGRDVQNVWSKMAADLNGLASPLSTPLPTPTTESKKEMTKPVSTRRRKRALSLAGEKDAEESLPARKVLRLSTSAPTSAPADGSHSARSPLLYESKDTKEEPVDQDTSDHIAKTTADEALPANEETLEDNLTGSTSLEDTSHPKTDPEEAVQDATASSAEAQHLQVEAQVAQPSVRSTRASATRAATTSTSARVEDRAGSAGASKISLKLTNTHVEPTRGKSSEATESVGNRRLSLRKASAVPTPEPKTPASAPRIREQSKGPYSTAAAQRSRRHSGTTSAPSAESKNSKPQLKPKVSANKLVLKKSDEDGAPNTELDGEGPYCFPDCKYGRLSEGEMVACENDTCPHEWYHFDCVHMVEMPKRTQKWFCPPCQRKLGVTERGEIVPRDLKGKKRKR